MIIYFGIFQFKEAPILLFKSNNNNNKKIIRKK